MDVDKALQTMIENLQKNTGKSLEEWIAIVKSENLAKHGQIVKFLKETHWFTHGFANMVAHRANESDASSIPDSVDLIAEQYKGKENLKPIYDALIKEINSWGEDFEIAPKKANVSLKRKKQFAVVGPATKTRFEIGLMLKGEEATARLEAEKPNAMCTHKIKISSVDELDAEVYTWLRKSFDKSI